MNSCGSRLTGALAAVMAMLASPTAGQIPVFRTTVDLVNMGVTVIDKKGQLISDLKADDFEIYEDGRPQAIRYFAAGETSEQPGPEMHLGLVLDVSESMGDELQFTRTAAIKFLNTLLDAVDVTVVDFDSEVRTARFSQAEFARLIERIRRQKTTGMTALYDAIGVYLDGAARQEGRKIMVLYTDGWDTRSSMRLSELLDLLKASDVTVYVVGAISHQSGMSRDQARTVLHAIAETTGGQAFFPTSTKDLDLMYEKVLGEIRAQYTIGYVSNNDLADGAWRRVEVKVAGKERKDFRIRSRKGYFAPLRGPSKP
jgi:Ca-activated chloride channel homolog